jgi:cytidine deaminase
MPTKLPTPELFVALVAATGTDLKLVRTVLSEELLRVSYDSETVHLSEELGVVFGDKRLTKEIECPEDDRIREAMNAGDRFREKHQHKAAVAILGIGKIKDIRENYRLNNGRGIAYIISSLKTPVEVTALRAIYGDLLFVISIYSPRSRRLKALTERIAMSRRISDREQFRSSAEKLIERDFIEIENDLGQNLQDTFPLADAFLRMEDKETLRIEVRRCVELLFGHPFLTPTRDEQGLFIAKSAALRSADLSRQVGAVITRRNGDVLAVGCNEVPGPGGGSHWPDDERSKDYRDFRIGYDTNSKMKAELVGELFKLLKESGWLSREQSEKSIQQLLKEALSEEEGHIPVLANAQISSIIEYGRIVHAEMHALMEAVRKGLSVHGATLYCTTFPCHICSRHILASGIYRVVYIEPYPKSMTVRLYDRMVKVDEEPCDEIAVNFEPFVGIAPRRYMQLFEMRARKHRSDGTAIQWDPRNSKLKILETNVKGFEYIPSVIANYKDGEDSALEMLEVEVDVKVQTGASDEAPI